MANEKVGKWTPVDGAVNILVDAEWDPSVGPEARVEALKTLEAAGYSDKARGNLIELARSELMQRARDNFVVLERPGGKRPGKSGYDLVRIK